MKSKNCCGKMSHGSLPSLVEDCIWPITLIPVLDLFLGLAGSDVDVLQFRDF